MNPSIPHLQIANSFCFQAINIEWKVFVNVIITIFLFVYGKFKLLHYICIDKKV